MNLQKYKWSLVALVIVLTLTILVFSQFLWHHFALETPLYQTIQGVDGVETVTWDNNDKNSSIPRIHITLNKVTNLQKTYQEITDSLVTILGSKKYKLFIHDHHTAELEQLYYSIHPYIQEAIFTGKFSTMTEIIQEKSSAIHAKSQIYIDANYIYVHLMDDNSNFYMVIPRSLANGEVK